MDEDNIKNLEEAEIDFEEALSSAFGELKEPKSTEKEDDRGDSPKEKQEELPEEGETPEDTEPEVKLPERPSKHPDLQEGDYELSEEGVYVLKAEHLVKDIETILKDDAGVYLKIAKAKPEKAEAIANILGIKSDDTRTAAEVMADVVRAIKSESDQEKANEIAKNHFPYLFDQDVAVPFEMPQIKKGEVAESPQVDISKEIDYAIYRVVAESGGKFTVDDINKHETLPQIVNKYHFDPETGRPLTPYEKLKKAADEVFSSAEAVTPPPVNTGGRKIPSKPVDKQAEAQTEFESALMRAFN